MIRTDHTMAPWDHQAHAPSLQWLWSTVTLGAGLSLKCFSGTEWSVLYLIIVMLPLAPLSSSLYLGSRFLRLLLTRNSRAL